MRSSTSARGIGTELYGRRMYEVMAVWETLPTGPEEPPAMREFAEIWRASDKVVYSTTLTKVSTSKTRLEKTFDPDAVRELVRSADQDVSISGPTLAAEAFRAGLINELHLYLAPVVIGSGNPALRSDIRLDLELVTEHRFKSGFVFLEYRVRS